MRIKDVTMKNHLKESGNGENKELSHTKNIKRQSIFLSVITFNVNKLNSMFK